MNLEQARSLDTKALHKAAAVVLVTPQLGENIGAAARAMLNCGLTDLRLVAPRDGWPNSAAERAAVGALDLMPPVQVFDRLGQAITDLTMVYATTARASSAGSLRTPATLQSPMSQP